MDAINGARKTDPSPFTLKEKQGASWFFHRLGLNALTVGIILQQMPKPGDTEPEGIDTLGAWQG